ncbi:MULTISPECIES: Fur family transcriptional regulator [Georgenia]|nr:MULTISPECIES: transcriptional repressor [Georgenia]
MSSTAREVEHDHVHHAAGPRSAQAAVAALRARGERITSGRRAVLDVLSASADHLTAEEVVAALGDSTVHRATVYRTLDLLVAAGVVAYRRLPGGATSYHLAATGEGYEHLHGYCHRCGTVVVLPADALDDVGELLRRAGFRLDARHSDLVGLCERCVSPD